MRPGTEACAILLAGLALLAGLPSERSQAYEWMTDRQIRNRSQDVVWELNPGDCPPRARALLEKASDLLDFYTLSGFRFRFGQDTERDAAVDGRYVVQCSPVLDYMERGYSFQSGGVTLVARSHGLITDADIILNADRLTFGIALHEFSHMLGLDHSEVPSSIVCHSSVPGHCRGRERLDADDLVGLAHLYDVPANCTPYLADDLSIYFPRIGGFWAELQPVDLLDPERGYRLAATGPSIDYDWQCNLQHSRGFAEVETALYHQGQVLEALFIRDGGLWYVEFPERETGPLP